MKWIRKPVEVFARDGQPGSFRYNERLYEIQQIEDRWVLQGNWWLREEKRRYFRVVTDRGIAVIYLREAEGAAPEWMLEEIFD